MIYSVKDKRTVSFMKRFPISSCNYYYYNLLLSGEIAVTSYLSTVALKLLLLSSGIYGVEDVPVTNT